MELEHKERNWVLVQDNARWDGRDINDVRPENTPDGRDVMELEYNKKSLVLRQGDTLWGWQRLQRCETREHAGWEGRDGVRIERSVTIYAE